MKIVNQKTRGSVVFSSIILLALMTAFVSGHQEFSDQVVNQEEALLVDRAAQNDVDPLQSARLARQAAADELDLSWMPEPMARTVRFFMVRRMEAFIICFTIFASINFFLGKSKNYRIALKWHQLALPAIRANFAHIGMENDQRTEFEETQYNEFTYYASGRANCYYSLFKTETKRRQDVFSRYVVDPLISACDTVIIDIPIKVAPYTLRDGTSLAHIPLELLVLKKKQVKAAFQSFDYLENFVTQTQNKHLDAARSGKVSGESLVVLAESDEASNFVIDKNVADVLTKYGDCILDMHITDQKIYSKQVPMNQLYLKVRIQITENDEQLNKALKVLKVLFYIVDRVCALRLTHDSRLKCKRTREQHTQLVKDDAYEANEQKKDEKARREQQAFKDKLKNLSPQEQRKLEEKRRLKEAKDQKKKLMKVQKY